MDSELLSKHIHVFVNVVQSVYDRVGVQECHEETLTNNCQNSRNNKLIVSNVTFYGDCALQCTNMSQPNIHYRAEN